MKGFRITTPEGTVICFRYYTNEAPQTCAAFAATLPFTKTLFHARVSGLEFWTDKAPGITVPQENASVFTSPGEVVIGPLQPARVKTAGAMGIYYGEGKGLDACNIFAKVVDDDLPLLVALGERIWRQGEAELLFENYE